MKENDFEKMITETVEAEGFEFVELKRERRGKFDILKLFIDCEEGVTINNCKKVSHIINDYIFTHDLLEYDYRLEVSSPGADRVLTKVRDFKRQVNRSVRIQYDDEEGNKSIEGILKEVDEEKMILVDRKKGKEKETELEFSKIISGKVVLPW